MKKEKTTEHTPLPTAEAIRDAQILQMQSRRNLSDILGSYTGTAKDNEPPEQDADDL